MGERESDSKECPVIKVCLARGFGPKGFMFAEESGNARATMGRRLSLATEEERRTIDSVRKIMLQTRTGMFDQFAEHLTRAGYEGIAAGARR